MKSNMDRRTDAPTLGTYFHQSLFLFSALEGPAHLNREHLLLTRWAGILTNWIGRMEYLVVDRLDTPSHRPYPLCLWPEPIFATSTD